MRKGQNLARPRSTQPLGVHYDPEAFGRFSETIARYLGTARFLIVQTALVILWIIINIASVALRWDPYPFILLNLMFSVQAAYAAPLILLAQNRQWNVTVVRQRTTVPSPRAPRQTRNSLLANSRACDCRCQMWSRSTNCATNSTTSCVGSTTRSRDVVDCDTNRSRPTIGNSPHRQVVPVKWNNVRLDGFGQLVLLTWWNEHVRCGHHARSRDINLHGPINRAVTRQSATGFSHHPRIIPPNFTHDP